MKNDQIQQLYEKGIKKLFEKGISYSRFSFIYWVEENIWTKEEMDIFIKWLNQLKDEEILEYMKKYGRSILSVITNQSDNLCKLAVDDSPENIQYVRNQTVDLCLSSLKKNPRAYRNVKIVPNPDFKTTFKNLLEKKAILDALK